jgi:hypothetical protein
MLMRHKRQLIGLMVSVFTLLFINFYMHSNCCVHFFLKFRVY